MSLSLNKIIKLLENCGFSTLDAKVYIYIAKLGPSPSKEISSQLGIKQQQLDQILVNLTKKRVLTALISNQTTYSALPFESLLKKYVETTTDQAEEIRKKREQLIFIWRALTKSK